MFSTKFYRKKEDAKDIGEEVDAMEVNILALLDYIPMLRSRTDDAVPILVDGREILMHRDIKDYFKWYYLVNGVKMYVSIQSVAIRDLVAMAAGLKKYKLHWVDSAGNKYLWARTGFVKQRTEAEIITKNKEN